MKFWIAMCSALVLGTACKNHGYLGKVECPTAGVNDSLYVEIHYQYGFIKERSREEIPAETLRKLDSLYTFTTNARGHEGWAVNSGKKYNDYYQPENFVVENPNSLKGEPRQAHAFSLFCPNKMSEAIRLHIDNDLNTSIREMQVSVKPFRYFYDRRADQYRVLLQITKVDTNFLAEPQE